ATSSPSSRPRHAPKPWPTPCNKTWSATPKSGPDPAAPASFPNGRNRAQSRQEPTGQVTSAQTEHAAHSSLLLCLATPVPNQSTLNLPAPPCPVVRAAVLNSSIRYIFGTRRRCIPPP